jgi:hypothetical protein
MQRRSVAAATVRPYHDLHVLIQRHKKTQKALHGKLAELASEHLGYIGLADPKQFGGLHLFQAALFHDGVNLEDQLSFDKMLICISNPDVFEHIPAADLTCLPAHGLFSPAIRLASPSRC